MSVFSGGVAGEGGATLLSRVPAAAIAGLRAPSMVLISPSTPSIKPSRRACSMFAALDASSFASRVAATPFKVCARRPASSVLPSAICCCSSPAAPLYWSRKLSNILRKSRGLPFARARAAGISKGGRCLGISSLEETAGFCSFSITGRGIDFAGIQRTSVSISAWGLIGFVRWSFIPASRLRSRSPLIA